MTVAMESGEIGKLPCAHARTRTRLVLGESQPYGDGCSAGCDN